MLAETASWLNQGLAGGRYRVTALLGEGGMGRVYRAQDRNLDCDVVIKVPRRAMLEDAEFAARFTREIRSLVKLSHPHIVKIYDVGEHDSVPFAVLQFLSGGSLRDRQQSQGDKRLPIPPQELGGWLDQVAAALDFIHQQGYIHRDIKPENILFDAHGNVYLSDFGVAKVLADNSARKQKTVMTGEGMVLGTPQYMAPELVMGQAYDGRVDQYALAVMVFELLTGAYPIDGPTATAIFVEKATKEAPPLSRLAPALPSGLTAAVQKALSRDARSRFPDCASFAKAVKKALGREGAVPPPSSSVPDGAWQGQCSGCHKVFSLPGTASGKQVRCPQCGSAITVPAGRPTATPPVQAALPTVARQEARIPTAVTPPARSKVPSPPDAFRQLSAPAYSQSSRTSRNMLVLSGVAAFVLVGTAAGLGYWLFGSAKVPDSGRKAGETTAQVAEAPAPKPGKAPAEPQHQTPPKSEEKSNPTDPPLSTESPKAKPAEPMPTLEPPPKKTGRTKPNQPRTVVEPRPRRRTKPAEPTPSVDPKEAPKTKAAEPMPVEPPPAPPRLAVPNTEAQQRAEQAIKEEFKVDYGRADVVTGKSSLAGKLLKAAAAANDDADRRYVLLREARDLASEAGKSRIALDAIDAMSRSFEVDKLFLKIQSLGVLCDNAGGPECRLVADQALSLVDDAVAADQYDRARSLLESAEKAARKGAFRLMLTRIETRSKEVQAALVFRHRQLETRRTFDEELRMIDQFFAGKDPVHKTLNRLIKRLDRANIPYAIMGGLALNLHRYRRVTTDVDVLLTAEGFTEFKKRFVEKNYQPVPKRGRRFIDRVNRVQIDILVTGLFPGTGKPGPIAFPDPVEVSEIRESRRVIDLVTLVQLKLAARRWRDFADVVELIRHNDLEESFAKKLHSSVRGDFIECLEEKRREDEYDARNG